MGTLRFPGVSLPLLIINILETISFFCLVAQQRPFLIDQLGIKEKNADLLVSLFHFLIPFFTIISLILTEECFEKSSMLSFHSGALLIGSACLLTSTAVSPHHFAAYSCTIGAVLIAFGIATNRACLAPFFAEQAPGDEAECLERMFGCYYLLASLSPIFGIFGIANISEYVKCYGAKCYMGSVAIITLLIFMACCIFVAIGDCFEKEKGNGKTVCKMMKYIWKMVLKKVKREKEDDRKDPPNHLETPSSHNRRQLENAEKVLRTVPVFIIAIPFFYIYGFQFTRWMEIGNLLNHRISPYYSMSMVTIMAINPLAVLVFSLLHHYVTCKIIKRYCDVSLRGKMIVGLFLLVLAAVAFAIIALKTDTEKEHRLLNTSHVNCLSDERLRECRLRVECERVGGEGGWREDRDIEEVMQVKVEDGNCRFTVTNCTNSSYPSTSRVLTFPAVGFTDYLVFSVNEKKSIEIDHSRMESTACKGGEIEIEATGCGIDESSRIVVYEGNYEEMDGSATEGLFFQSLFIGPKKRTIYVDAKECTESRQKCHSNNQYTLDLWRNTGGRLLLYKTNCDEELKAVEVSPPPFHNILWLLIPPIILANAEILLIFPAMEFVYSETSYSSKSIVQIIWFSFSAIGYLLNIIVLRMNVGVVKEQAVGVLLAIGAALIFIATEFEPNREEEKPEFDQEIVEKDFDSSTWDSASTIETIHPEISIPNDRCTRTSKEEE